MKKRNILLLGMLVGSLILSSCSLDFIFPNITSSDDITSEPTDDITTDPTDDITTDPTDDVSSDPTDSSTDPGTDPTDPGTDPTDPGTDPTDPGTDPTDPGTDPTDPGTDPTDPGTDPTDPGTNPTDPSTDPTDPGTDPTDPTPDEPENYYRSEVVDPYFNYQDLLKVENLNAIPTPRKDLNILVLPIEFTDYKFTTKHISDLEKVFNGTPAQTNYWESVASFYQKSSFDQVNIDFTVADVYDSGETASSATGLTAWYTYYFSTVLLRNAVDNYKQNNSTKQFDKDNDGFIDAVWMIYSCPNAGNSQTIADISRDYWAYVYWDYLQEPSKISPNANVHAWASYDFMYYGGNTSKLDAHTYIHETGHLFGLDDYYNYDDNSKDGPMGGLDMMDYNVIDHNVWSKMALGWLKPYVVTGDATITISPSQVNGDAIILANNWNGTSFDEFLLLELYTPTGLNELDSSTKYLGGYPRGFTVPGVRIYHVDSRLGLFSYGGRFIEYGHPSDGSLTTTRGRYGVAHSNTPSFTANKNRLLHMIQAGKFNTYKNGWQGTNVDLFKTGNVFSINDYSDFFKNKKLNNGETLDYEIEFLSVTEEEATIKFSQI